MSNIQKMKKELQLKKLEIALADMEIRRLERYEEIERIEKNIEIQKKAIEDLKQEIK